MTKVYCPGVAGLCDHDTKLCLEVETGAVATFEDVFTNRKEAIAYGIAEVEAGIAEQVAEVLADRQAEANFQRKQNEEAPPFEAIGLIIVAVDEEGGGLYQVEYEDEDDGTYEAELANERYFEEGPEHLRGLEDDR